MKRPSLAVGSDIGFAGDRDEVPLLRLISVSLRSRLRGGRRAAAALLLSHLFVSPTEHLPLFVVLKKALIRLEVERFTAYASPRSACVFNKLRGLQRKSAAVGAPLAVPWPRNYRRAVQAHGA